ncbi:hypothetical protein GCM10018790_04180 [Kitasatospora xanthocidica]|uniref:RICIN domain-containing protein n=1 Tax=Kitasatospora xanthocidica TaxID=83382 RepID=UPI0016795C57|nr:RICIN domain-containing protein [Kitasatospora xanthocidica]GHF29850.1 hypothetical protein GCM10018790_04180 [Kitasatospora xanthocidica]
MSTIASATALLLVSQPASAAPATPATSTALTPTRIINIATKKCLEVADWRIDDGTPIRQWDCTGGANQSWYIVDIYGVNRFTLANAFTHKCVDIPGENAYAGAALVQWECNYNANQRFWKYSASSTGPVYSFQWNRYAIEIGGFSSNNGAPAQLWDINGGTNQAWYAGD